jgi:hypothetical protein
MKKLEKFEKFKINSTNKISGGDGEAERGIATTYTPSGTQYTCADRWYLFKDNNVTGTGHTDYSTDCK